jgi:tetratricopeptide (TPR) repeat protein
MNLTLKRFLATVVVAASFGAAAGSALAADTAPSKSTPLDNARALIAQKKWPAAIDELKRVNDTGGADWNNLMGYSLRKGPTPDYKAAERYYDEALRIDPKHRGALEYSGQLYLMTDRLPLAEERLATLDKVCNFGCEEYSDLKAAVARYKSNGNKFVAKE